MVLKKSDLNYFFPSISGSRHSFPLSSLSLLPRINKVKHPKMEKEKLKSIVTY